MLGLCLIGLQTSAPVQSNIPPDGFIYTGGQQHGMTDSLPGSILAQLFITAEDTILGVVTLY